MFFMERRLVLRDSFDPPFQLFQIWRSRCRVAYDTEASHHSTYSPVSPMLSTCQGLVQHPPTTLESVRTTQTIQTSLAPLSSAPAQAYLPIYEENAIRISEAQIILSVIGSFHKSYTRGSRSSCSQIAGVTEKLWLMEIHSITCLTEEFKWKRVETPIQRPSMQIHF